MPLPRFAVVDLETSGLSTRRSRILQIAVVTVEADGTVVDEWCTLVSSRWPLQRVGPTHIHGITRSRLRGQPSLSTAIDEFHRRVEGAFLTAHNAEFDHAFLNRATRQQLSAPLCTLKLSRSLDPDRQRSHGLGDICRYYGVRLDRPHDALVDAHATAQILRHLLNDHHITDLAELDPFRVASAGVPIEYSRRQQAGVDPGRSRFHNDDVRSEPDQHPAQPP